MLLRFVGGKDATCERYYIGTSSIGTSQQIHPLFVLSISRPQENSCQGSFHHNHNNEKGFVAFIFLSDEVFIPSQLVVV
jgi:hypothetical protein